MDETDRPGRVSINLQTIDDGEEDNSREPHASHVMKYNRFSLPSRVSDDLQILHKTYSTVWLAITSFSLLFHFLSMHRLPKFILSDPLPSPSSHIQPMRTIYQHRPCYPKEPSSPPLVPSTKLTHVLSQNRFNLLLRILPLHNQSLTPIHRPRSTQFRIQKRNDMLGLTVHSTTNVGNVCKHCLFGSFTCDLGRDDCEAAFFTC